MKTKNAIFPMLLVGTLFSTSAFAQSVDYGMLEGIFGEPVTTSATGKPQRASEAPVAMKIISSEEIRRSGAQDVPQLLQRVAGVEVNRSYVGGADVSIRGFARAYSNRILVLVNGRQILQDHFGTTFWSMLPVQMDEIRQIEVVKGPNSSLFGFNAESGVINIITFDPLKDDIDVIHAGVGNREHKQAGGIATFKAGEKTGVRLSVSTEEMDGFNRDNFQNPLATSNNKDSANALNSNQYNIDAVHQLTDNAQLRLQSNYVAGSYMHLLPYYGAQSKIPTSIMSNHLNYKNDSQYGSWDVNLYRNSMDWQQASIGLENDLTVFKVDNLFKSGVDHTFKLGGEYRYNSAKGILYGEGNNKFDYDLYAVSGMWDWALSDRLSMTNSLRYDYMQTGRDEVPTFGDFQTTSEPFDRTIEEVSFNTGLVYRVTDTDKFRFSMGRGLHVPSLVEFGSGAGTILNGAAGFFGDPTLQTERILSTEVGYTKDLPKYDTTLGINLFVQKMENALGTDISFGVPIAFKFNNAGDAESTGIELEAEGVYKQWLRWGANYTYISVEDNPNGGEMAFEGTQPKHQVSLYGGFDRNKWEFDGDLHWISSMNYRAVSNAGPGSTVREEHIEDYFVLNARVGYNWSERTNVSLNGYNLIDKHRESLRTTGGASGDVGAETLGRSVLLNLRHTF